MADFALEGGLEVTEALLAARGPVNRMLFGTLGSPFLIVLQRVFSLLPHPEVKRAAERAGTPGAARSRTARGNHLCLWLCASRML